MPHNPCFAYRITVDGRVVAYTGDSEWTESIIAAGRDAGLQALRFCGGCRRKLSGRTKGGAGGRKETALPSANI